MGVSESASTEQTVVEARLDRELPVARKLVSVVGDENRALVFSMDHLPEIIKRLPPPLPDAAPRQIVVSAWPLPGLHRITLAVRRNALPDIHTWYWAVESTERIDDDSRSLQKP
jgi:hypothetical protein